MIRRISTRLFKLLVVLFSLGIIIFICSFAVMVAGMDGEKEAGTPDAAIVLGAYASEEGPSELLQARLDAAAEYLKEHPDVPVVVSGGKGDNEPRAEAEAMAEYLIEKGVSPDSIKKETQSRNTYQNLRYSRNLLGKDVEHVLIISNGFHLSRAKLLARRIGFEQVSTLASKVEFTPDLAKMYVREPVALVKSLMLDGVDQVLVNLLF